MTAEEIFIDWLNKQEFWLKKLYYVLIKNSVVTDEDIKNIIDDYVQQNFTKINIALPPEKSKKISLKKLYEVKGVNRLIPDQEIDFGENLTVIYGDNGTGKTGYSRVIQHVGKFMSKVAAIKTNVFDSTVSPKAKIDYVSEGDQALHTLDWDDTKDGQLNIRLFNSSCVQFSLNADRKISFKPYIFTLCEQLADATVRLSSKATERLIEFHGSALSTIESNTEVYKQVENVLNTCNKNDLLELDKFVKSLNSDSLSEQLKTCLKEQEQLSIVALNAEISKYSDRNTAINQILEEINHSEAFTGNWNKEFKENENKIHNLQQIDSVENILQQININKSIQKEFTNFIVAFDKMYKVLIGDSYSLLEMENCPFCGQAIQSTATDTIDLLKHYEKLLKANQSENIDNYLKRNRKIEEAFNRTAEKLLIYVKSPAISDEEEITVIMSEIVSYFQSFKCEQFREKVTERIQKLKGIVSSNLETIKSKQSSILQIEDSRKKLQERVNELKAQQYLVSNWEIERAYILSYINLSALKNLNNHSISRCQKDIQDKVYKKNFVEVLKNTLRELNAPREVKFDTAIISSQMAIKQGYEKIGKENMLSDILSEGEQTVVALAQFIAESKFDPNENVLFFDDPVNSLDLGRMEVIAKALVKLANQKQIIIFTHNLVFLGSIKAIIDKNKDLKHYKFYQTEKTEYNGSAYVGKLTERDNPNVESCKYYKAEIEKGISQSEKTVLSLEEIKRLYGCMRSAIELLICSEMLKGTTERYRPDISVMRFARINFDAVKDDQDQLTDLYEKTCRFIDGHSSSPAAQINPDILTLKEDYVILKTIAKKYIH